MLCYVMFVHSKTSTRCTLLNRLLNPLHPENTQQTMQLCGKVRQQKTEPMREHKPTVHTPTKRQIIIIIIIISYNVRATL